MKSEQLTEFQHSTAEGFVEDANFIAERQLVGDDSGDGDDDELMCVTE